MGLGWYLYYKGQYYDAGTKVKIRNKSGEIETATYLGGGSYEPYVSYFSLNKPETYIVEIIEPVYYYPQQQDDAKKSSVFTRTGSGSWNSHDNVFYGLLLYIAVMIVGAIFKDRWLIWIMATVIFFGWKAKK